MNRIPSALSLREDAALRRWSKDRRVVEAGALLGHSTVEIGRVARSLISIDRHTGYDNQPNNTLRQYMRNLEVAFLNIAVLAIVGDAVTELPKYSADFVFIDLCGTHAVTLAAIQAARAPFVGVHDYQRQNCKGVGSAIEAIGFPVIERTDSLVILRKA